MRNIVVFIVIIAGMFSIFCTNNPVNTDDPPISAQSTRIAAATTAADYSASNFEIISTDDYAAIPNLINRLHTDHIVKAFGDNVYILERNGRDNVIKYNAAKMAAEYQQNLGIDLNIQDIAVINGSKAYITAHNTPELIIFDPTAGTKISSVDLSQFNSYAKTDSAETSPFAGPLALYGNYLYVACQRLKSVQEVWGTNIVVGDTSLIVVINTITDEIVKGIRLNKKNPAAMSVFGNYMLVSSQGDWSNIGGEDAGVEIIDLSENVNIGIAANGGNLGGNPSNIVFISHNKAYVCVMTEFFSTDIVPFDPLSGEIGAKIDGIGDAFGGLAYDGINIYTGDRGFGSAGIAVINTETNTIEQKIVTGMPPSSLAIIFAD